MTEREFTKLLKARLSKTSQLLEAKGDVYARGDRLSNFKRAAIIQNIEPETALRGMMTKHLVAILDMIDDIEGSEVDEINLAEWDEKIGDVITYSILLEALIKERAK